VAAALATTDESEARWDAVRELQDRGTRDVLDAAVRLSTSPDPHARELGADILGQNTARPKTFHEESVVAPLVAMIDGGWEGMLIRQAVEALRHPDVLAALTRLLEILGPDDAKEWAWAEALLADAS
jgi:hypothetical protein